MWAAIVILVVVNLLIATARTSLINARMPYLLDLRERRPEAVDRTINLIERPRLRISLRVAVVLSHFLLAVLGIAIIREQTGFVFTTTGLLAVAALMAVIVLLLEFLVEWRVLKEPESSAVAFTWVGSLLDFLLAPLSALLFAVWGKPQAMDHPAGQVTEDELRNWVEEGKTEGGLEEGERKMIYSIFHFSDTLTREIMVPRIDVLALEITTPVAEAIDAMNRTGHSRLPVFEENIDNIVGILHAKDMLRVLDESAPLDMLRSILRAPYFVPEAKKVDELLTELQSQGVHMAIVVDEYGGMAGLVTLEDIVEEIVGEIRDEYDQGEEQLFQQVSDDEYVFQGKIDLDDFNEIMGTHLVKDFADTLGGFIYSEIGRVPVGGETVQQDGVTLTIEQVIGRRIRKVRAARVKPDMEKEGENGNAER